MKILLGLLTFTLVATRNADAQSVPLVAVDVAAGSGSTSSHANELWFRSSHTGMASADVAVRLGSVGATRGVLVVGYSATTDPSSVTADCPLAPNGSCKVPFPSTHGALVGLGLRQALGGVALLGVTAGIGSYFNQAHYISFEATWRATTHLGLTARYRYFEMPDAGGHVWFAPITGGVSATW